MFNRLRQLGLSAELFEKASMKQLENNMRQSVLSKYSWLVPQSVSKGKKLTGGQEIDAINAAGDKYHQIISELRRKDATQRALDTWEHNNASKDFNDAKYAIFSDHSIQPDDYRRKLTTKYDDVFKRIEDKKAAYHKKLED
jgi:hypothetical protein